MSATALLTTPASATAKPFILTVGGADHTGKMPVGDFPCRITETADGGNQFTFTLEDMTGRAVNIDYGAEIRLLDKRTGSRTLFGGWLGAISATRRKSARGRLIECTGTGYDASLDWRIVPSWSSRTNVNGHIRRIDNDRDMVQSLVQTFAGFLQTPNSTVDLTNSNMENVTVRGVSLREALRRVADTATTFADDPNRVFYVDNDKYLHWYRRAEGLTAPYRIADGSYLRDVLATAGLVAYWPMGEQSGTFAVDANGYAHAQYKGGVQHGQTAGCVNETAYEACLLNGSSGYLQVGAGASLHPGDTFSFECWFRRGRTGVTETLWSSGASDFQVAFRSSDDAIGLAKNNISYVWVTDAAYTDKLWHHLVVTKTGATRAIYVDGEESAGSGTNATIIASATAPNIGRDAVSVGQNFYGDVQHVAVYSTALSAATVLAHYRQGVSITPELLTLEGDALGGREAVYVAGSTAKGADAGSGWVMAGGVGIGIRTAFGRASGSPQRREFISRPDSDTGPRKKNYATAFLREQNDPVLGGNFTVTGHDGWRVGQALYITDSAIAPGQLDGTIAYEIRQVDTDVNMGNGKLTYTVQFGKPIYSASRHVARRTRRGR